MVVSAAAAAAAATARSTRKDETRRGERGIRPLMRPVFGTLAYGELGSCYVGGVG
ncbi:hypothetical protein NEUTE1DRAFT_115736 [Neurospora tetrasperma FGSC 2508]|uniref:Uncharacterized protein n=1 Tax=Neurospora tetrasperma (strain FGSC 2508 / ATCC MYA-4615 / P0657) TaxID=510951 RepID=F8MCG0_NEUT8|nr:uncharacterized protein NEUTE1DRAFT_115736 [Neurospora tetrasperma FGSC 2508]EGO60461.1 hypothetical protein NEUTE1DRAFT_115736 [Neurospora tetrasperma FGSC 2508]EGZ75566.1 hypothetical protein NEUTE2DRAFT_143746 [Neurospora tetrasperma FGSC 2509]